MDVTEELSRADSLVADGRLRAARDVLLAVVREHPQRLDVRERLAAVHRQEGDLAQAGRWGFLADDGDAAEVEAFRAAFAGDPLAIMAALEWDGYEGHADTATARERLTQVRKHAEAATGRTLTWAELRGTPSDRSGREVPDLGAGGGRSTLRNMGRLLYDGLLSSSTPLRERLKLWGMSLGILLFFGLLIYLEVVHDIGIEFYEPYNG